MNEDDEDTDAPVAVNPTPDTGSDNRDLMASAIKRQEERSRRVAQLYAAAEERLRTQHTGPDKRDMWLSLAAAFARPTQTGGFIESLGNAADAYRGYRQDKSKAEEDRNSALDALTLKRAQAEDQSGSSLDEMLLKYSKPQRLAFNPVTGDAQDAYTGRIIRPGNSDDTADVPKPTVVPGSDPRVGGDPKRNYIIYPKRMGKAPSLVEGQPSNEMETYTDPEGRLFQRRKGSGEPYVPAPIQGGQAEDPEAPAKDLARTLGVPYQPPRIPAGMGKKARDAYIAKRANDGQNRLGEVAEDVQQGQNLLNITDQFMSIAGRTKTGPAYQYMPSLARPKDINELEGIQQNLIPLQPRTPGAISNFEAVGLGKGTLSPYSSMQANQSRANRTKAYVQLTSEYQDFLDSWSQVHGGSIDGADAVWARYLRAQPIIDPKRPDIAAPNPNRLSWKEWSRRTYYGRKASAPRPAAPTPAASPASRIKIISAEPIR